MLRKKQCKETNSSGEPCQAAASESGYCFTHNPELADERAIARRRGGLQKAAPHLADADKCPKKVRSMESVMCVLDYALQETLGLANGIQRGRLIVSIAHGYIEAIKADELDKRLEAIETALKLRKSEQTAKGKDEKKWLH